MSDRPNVLFICVDDMNDYVGFLGGHPDAQTPHLDALAARSTVFANAHCPAPICNPSRAALLSGRHPSTTGVYDNRQPLRTATGGQEIVTLPQHFRQHGYHVSGAGKCFHIKFPDPASWDDYFPHRGDTLSPIPDRLTGPVQGVAPVRWSAVDLDERAQRDHPALAVCKQRLAAAPEEPWFLTMGLSQPHVPWNLPRRFLECFDPARIALPPGVEEDGDLAMASPLHRCIVEAGLWRPAVAAYLAAQAYADHLIGELLAALDASPQRERTIVVFWSDHGWHCGEHGQWQKATLWERSTRVPLLIHAPGIAPGRVAAPASLVDVYPTLLELCGLPMADRLDGHSLLPWMRDPAHPEGPPARCTHGTGNHALRSRRWRYVRTADGVEQLFDHQHDPHEHRDLASDPAYADIIADHARWLPEHEAEPAPAVRWPDDVETVARAVWQAAGVSEPPVPIAVP